MISVLLFFCRVYIYVLQPRLALCTFCSLLVEHTVTQSEPRAKITRLAAVPMLMLMLVCTSSISVCTPTTASNRPRQTGAQDEILGIFPIICLLEFPFVTDLMSARVDVVTRLRCQVSQYLSTAAPSPPSLSTASSWLRFTPPPPAPCAADLMEGRPSCVRALLSAAQRLFVDLNVRLFTALPAHASRCCSGCFDSDATGS